MYRPLLRSWKCLIETNKKYMKSEVERNQKLVLVGDVLLYTDNYKLEKWVVTELFKGGFEALSESEMTTDKFIFSQLQFGWEISSDTKYKNTLLKDFNYV